MESSPFFSVVMPVYKVERYLPAAVESILAQSFPDFELILVDDASPDASGAICEEYARRDGRVRTVRLKENGGLSRARNQGMRRAAGRYIFFMDSDDRVEPDLFETAAVSLRENPVQCLLFGLTEEYVDAEGRSAYRRTVVPPRATAAGREELRRQVIELERRTLYGYAWNKFYLLSYLRAAGLEFEPVTLIEDIRFNVDCFTEMESLTMLPIAAYHYRKSVGAGLTERFVPEYFALHQERVRMILEQHRRWGMCTDEVRATLGGIYIRCVLSALQRNCDSRAGLTHRGRRQWAEALLREPLYRELEPHLRSESGVLNLLAFLLRRRRVGLCLACGRGVYFLKTRTPLLFARFKQKGRR